MLSSTSNSSDARREAHRTFILIVAVVILTCLGTEVFTRATFVYLDRGHQQIRRERQLALNHSGQGASAPIVLFVGNSLLEAGVRFDQVQAALAPRFEARRFVVPDTTYFDWYYGIKRLLREGARPTFVVLFLVPRQLMNSSVRGEYFARMLMATDDILGVAKDVNAHPTVTANLLFANLSEFYGVRAEVRKGVLKRVLPDLPLLTAKLVQSSPTEIDDAALKHAAEVRLASLQSLLRAYNAALIFVVPPVPSDPGHPGALTIADAGARVGVPVLSLPSRAIPPDDFSDGFHLNERGAQLFTDRLILMLEGTLPSN